MSRDDGYVKIHRKILRDSKVLALREGERWLFMAYILLAEYKGKWRGYLVDDLGKPYSQRKRADLCGGYDEDGKPYLTKTQIARADKKMLQLGLIETNEYGWIKLRNYDRYQAHCPDQVGTGVPSGHQNGHRGAQDDDGEQPAGHQTGHRFGHQNGHRGAQTNGRTRSQEYKEDKEVLDPVPNPKSTPERIPNTDRRDSVFENEFWTIYPRKIEKAKARKAWAARMREGVEPDALVQGATHYAAHCRTEDTETRYIKHAATFLGPDKVWEDWQDAENQRSNGGRRGRGYTPRLCEADKQFKADMAAAIVSGAWEDGTRPVDMLDVPDNARVP